MAIFVKIEFLRPGDDFKERLCVVGSANHKIPKLIFLGIHRKQLFHMSKLREVVGQKLIKMHQKSFELQGINLRGQI